MGFFLEDTIAEQRIANVATTSRVARSSIIDPAAVGCDHCSLRQTWNYISTPRMPLSGNTRNADVLILGASPLGDDDTNGGLISVNARGRQVTNPGTKMILDSIPHRHSTRVAFQNMVRCLPNSSDPTPRDVHACSVHLNMDIDSLPLKAIIGCGTAPLRRFFPGASIQRVNGNKLPVMTGRGPVWYYPILDPHYLLWMQRLQDRDTTAYNPVFEADLRSFFRNIDTWEAPVIHDIKPEHVIIATSREEAMAYIDALEEPVGADIETSKLSPYMIGAKIITAAASDGKTTVAWVCEHPEAPTDWGMDVLLHLLLTKRWIAHQAAFELAWFLWTWSAHQNEIKPFDDSMALGRLYHERETLLSLEDMSLVHLGVNLKSLTRVSAKNIMAYPLEEVLPYNGLDAWGSAMLWRHLYPKVNKPHYQDLIERIVATVHMELMGLPVDLQMSAKLAAHWDNRIQEIATDIRRTYEVRRFEAERMIEFDLASNDHIGIALTAYGKLDLPRTNNANKVSFKTDEEALQPYVDTNPLAKLVLLSREARLMRSTFVDPILRVPTVNVDANLHGKYTVLRTATYRLSSEDPNMQNYPSRKHRELRDQVVPEEGHYFVKFDFGQIQVRIIGIASRDKRLIRALIDGTDMHSFWRDRLLTIYPDYWPRLIEKTNETDTDKILKGARNIIKTDFVFSSFFGSSAKSNADRTGVPLIIMQQLTGEFWEEFSGVEKWIKACRNEYRDTGAISTITGHRRRGVMTGNEPINTPVQLVEAVIVGAAMCELNQLARTTGDYYYAPRIQIHDDLTFMLPNDNRLEGYVSTIKDVLIRKRFPWLTVPLNVEGSIGNTWGNFMKFDEYTGDYNPI